MARLVHLRPAAGRGDRLESRTHCDIVQAKNALVTTTDVRKATCRNCVGVEAMWAVQRLRELTGGD